MRAWRHWRAPVALYALSLVAAWGCGDDGDDGTDPQPTVVLSGSSSVTIGGTTELSATTMDGADTGYTWTSANEAIATVDSTGTVTGVAAGETRITATGDDTGASGSLPVVVLPDAPDMPRVTLDVPSVFLELGASVELTASTENGTDGDYLWTSSDPDVASVSDGGATATVTAARTLPGSTFEQVTITATGADTGAQASVTLVIGTEAPAAIAWSGSAHADDESESFRHWDEDGSVPTSCAKCHTTSGLLDYYGEGGGPLYVVDEAVELGETVECAACHDATVASIDAVPFPSGEVIDEFDTSAPVQTCMTCHQGRASTDSVRARITSPDMPDAVQGDLGFTNIHYYAAAATLFAGQVRGGYQYEGAVYDWRFRHVEVADNCIGCHDPHALTLKTELCSQCHTDSDPRMIRMPTSREDYDGDGLCPTDACTADEGIAGEVETLRVMLYDAITTYAEANAATDALCYQAGRYPYVFEDQNGDGECTAADEVDGSLVAYTTFTPRLAKATYNYQVVTVEPGSFAHNAKYIIQLLYDSIVDLNTGIATAGGTPIDLSGATRNDMGHFNGAGEAARHWDEDAEVSASCSMCHAGSEGFVAFLETGMTVDVEEQANGLDCRVCHANVGSSALGERPDEGPWAVRGGPLNDAGEPYIPFPGVEPENWFSSGDRITDMCSTCHLGRASGDAVEAAIAAAGVTGDDQSFSARFVNPHYKAAGATRWGTQSDVGAEFPMRTYAGYDTHLGGERQQCNFCHAPADNNHSFDADDQVEDTCATVGCHEGATDAEDIRLTSAADYDGDGNASEPLEDELGDLEPGEMVGDCFDIAGEIVDDTCGMSDILLLTMNEYANDQGLSNICFKPDQYPYFFVDQNGDSFCGAEDTASYMTWTANLLRAAYNYQLVHTEPGFWAHNRPYATQLLYDSIEALGGDVSGLVR